MNAKKRFKVRQELKMKKCRYCKSIENLTIDHKHPIILGGSDELKNLQCLCKKCNGIKSNIPDKKFRRIMKYGVEIALNRGKVVEVKTN